MQLHACHLKPLTTCILIDEWAADKDYGGALVTSCEKLRTKCLCKSQLNTSYWFACTTAACFRRARAAVSAFAIASIVSLCAADSNPPAGPRYAACEVGSTAYEKRMT